MRRRRRAGGAGKGADARKRLAGLVSWGRGVWSVVAVPRLVKGVIRKKAACVQESSSTASVGNGSEQDMRASHGGRGRGRLHV